MRVRYVKLPPSQIFNTLDPQHQGCAATFWGVWGDTWWEPETVKKRQFYAQCFKEEHDNITGHFTKLRQSILAEGLRHPVLVVSGKWRDSFLTKPIQKMPDWFPPNMIENPDDALYVHTHGGSRFMMAEELKVDLVPCAVHDFADMFPNAPEISKANFTQYFGTGYKWTQINVRIVNKLHHHLLDDQKYRGMNEATKIAQRTATKNAIARTREKYNIPT